MMPQREPIDTCPFCGSSNLKIDRVLEAATCRDCHSSVGGANMWKRRGPSLPL
jgi:RNA polymerase subunit RPABC4/transcription elongation factor Spt4